MNVAVHIPYRQAAAALSFRLVCLALTGFVVAAASPLLIGVANGAAGIYELADYVVYMNATERWLAGGPFYYPEQLAGPYDLVGGHVLYPPVALLLFAPFTMLPPAWSVAAWLVIPIGLTVYAMVKLRPGPAAWPVMAIMLLMFPWSMAHVMTGNPDIWALAFMSLGMLHRWPAVLVLFKPSIGIFALWGVRDRRWWATLAVFAAVSLVFLPMWFDWLRVVLNTKGGGLLYSLPMTPMLLAPIAAWLARPGGRWDFERRRASRNRAESLRGGDIVPSAIPSRIIA